MPEQPGLRIEIERTKGGPEQLAAWRRLWMKLLAAPTTTHTADRTEKGKTILRGCQEDEDDHGEGGR